MLLPGHHCSPGFDIISPPFDGTVSMRHQRFAYARLSHSYMTCLVHAFSVSFTTGPFGPSRIRLFEASPYRAGSEGPEYRSNRER